MRQTKQAAMGFENISSNAQNQEILEFRGVEEFGRKSLKNKHSCFALAQSKTNKCYSKIYGKKMDLKCTRHTRKYWLAKS